LLNVRIEERDQNLLANQYRYATFADRNEAAGDRDSFDKPFLPHRFIGDPQKFMTNFRIFHLSGA
jgi:hypothetical protein